MNLGERGGLTSIVLVIVEEKRSTTSSGSPGGRPGMGHCTVTARAPDLHWQGQILTPLCSIHAARASDFAFLCLSFLIYEIGLLISHPHSVVLRIT